VSDQPQPQQPNLDLSLPPERRAGVFADAAMVWHNQHSFTLDFLSQWAPGLSESGGAQVEVVARVRVPTGVIFQLARAIAENLDNYERQFGPIQGGPQPPPPG
jgi:hypothetical protein